ncbi:hypothetical protein [Paenibacillus sp. 276b]|uniref:hypothetical protein n=1 Tax=Paenibacillus sp. 276b TaxID=1566277 RepID=UPI0008988D95|nr:hypothetical protein [Paenibacillus sp. 276b]SEB28003.1 hypothetical protein SAMN03159332_0088 [Paenibacillus sp. 276b]
MPLIDNYLLDNYLIDGPSGIKYATGVATSGTVLTTVSDDKGESVSNVYNLLTVNGLDFKPERIILYYSPTDIQGVWMVTYSIRSRGRTPTSDGANHNLTTSVGTSNYARNIRTYEYSTTSPPATPKPSVGVGWFILPVFYGGTNYYWEAFGTVNI